MPNIWAGVELHRLISLGLVLLAPVLGYTIGHTKNPELRWGLVAAQLVAAAATWLIGEGRAKRIEQERIDAATETRVALSDALEPTLKRVGELVLENAAGRRQQRGAVVEVVLVAATGLAPSESRPRACYFKASADGRRLDHERSVGRAVAAKASFVAGTPEGDAALKMVDDNDMLFCDDVRENPPPGWVPSERGEYKTFISVPVRSGHRVYGMLTLDAKTPGSLTSDDGDMLRALGHILGVVEGLSG